MNPKQKQLFIVIAVVVVAVVAVGVVIAVSGRTNASHADYAALPQSRTSDGAFVLGNPDAPVTIIEFADFGCPHCVEYRPEIERFITDYVVPGRAKFEFRMFPTAGGSTTLFAGQLAECIEEQKPGGFWDAYSVLFDVGTTGQYFSDDMGRVLAQRVGIDNYSELLTCSRDANQINTDIEFGRTLGVSGTPAVLVRYDGGNPQWITYSGVTYDRGSVPFAVLAAVVEDYSL